MSIVGRLADLLWNPWLLALFLITGALLTAGSGFFVLRRFPLWWRATAGSLLRPSSGGNGGGITPFRALAAALAATMGTGSIAGVSTALCLGGPGAVFWMWVSALAGMTTSYVEKYLAVAYHRPAPGGGWMGGPMYYLRHGLGSPLLAGWFALACLPATLAGGNLAQSGAIAAALHAAFGLPPFWVGLAAALGVGLVMAGGFGRIAQVSAWLVPAMALLYLGAGGLVLAARAQAIPGALAQILDCALSPAAALGGGAGYTLHSAMRYGVARGVFTNEAGLGTSAMAHGAAQVDHPARQGLWGIFEVFFATPVVCTVTALVVLVTGVYDPAGTLALLELGPLPPAASGAPLTARAFSAVLGPAGGWVVAASLLLFAFSSLLGWSYYGEQCLGYLAGSPRLRRGYRLLFLACVWAGALLEPTAVWELVDLCNALMALPNLAGILLLAPQALGGLNDWLSQGGGDVFPSRRI